MSDGCGFPLRDMCDTVFGIYRYRILYRFEMLWLTAEGGNVTEPALELQLDPASYRSGRLQELDSSQVGCLVELRIAAAKKIPDVELGFHFSRYELSKIRDGLHEG
jgi:hypothetical protein